MAFAERVRAVLPGWTPWADATPATPRPTLTEQPIGDEIVSPDPFIDIIGRHFTQPKEGLRTSVPYFAPPFPGAAPFMTSRMAAAVSSDTRKWSPVPVGARSTPSAIVSGSKPNSS